MTNLIRLDQMAKEQRLTADANKALQCAITRLVMAHFVNQGKPENAFFATLALRLKPRVATHVATRMGNGAVMVKPLRTACTDGVHLVVNPFYFMALSSDERVGDVVHEVMHAAHGHQTRLGHRDPTQGNIAMDLEVNGILRDAGFTLARKVKVDFPDGEQELDVGVFPGEGRFSELPSGKNFEWYYENLPKDAAGPKGAGEMGLCLVAGSIGEPGEGNDGTDPNGCFHFPAAGAGSEQEWKQAVAEAAMVARRAGHLPGSLDLWVDEFCKTPPTPWQDIIEARFRALRKDDYSWRHPNRRLLAQGIYLPSLRSEGIGELVIFGDMSGSIGNDERNKFAQECRALLEACPVRMHFVWHDSIVQHHETWEPEDGELTIHPKGGGGTNHRPCGEWMREHDEIDPDVVIFLTDAETMGWPDPEPFGNAQVIWAVVNNEHPGVPFGEVIQVELG